MAHPAEKPMTTEEFLAWEAGQEDRWEFVAGEAHAMVGGTVAHNTVTLNIASTLKARLKGQGGTCRVFMDSMKVVAPSGDVMYPDVMVSCGEPSPSDTHVSDPVLVVEVLSPGTEVADRKTKWYAYQTIPSLQVYVLVSQEAEVVETFTRDGGTWRYEKLTAPQAVLDLEPLGVRLGLEEIYEGVFVPQTAAGEG